MPRIPGINHLAAIKAFEKAGFRVLRQSKHIIMGKGELRLIIPRNNPIDALTMGGIVADAELSQDEFMRLLK